MDTDGSGNISKDEWTSFNSCLVEGISTKEGSGAGRQSGQTSEGSFSAISAPNFAVEASFRTDLHSTHPAFPLNF